MRLINRNHCVLSKDRLINLLTIENFPIMFSCTNQDPGLDIRADMVWGVGEGNNLIQLLKLVPMGILYRDSHNSGTVGKTWKEHHKKFSDFIKVDAFNSVLEVGGAAGTLVEEFIKTSEEFSWDILEPSFNGVPHKDSRVHYHSDFFETFQSQKRYDAVVHSHVFEHIYNPLDFLIKASKLLVNKGVQYISIPNMKYWLSEGFSNTLMFEHTFYVDIDVLKSMLAQAGFVIDRELITDHSIFVSARKCETIKRCAGSENFSYSEEMFLKFLSGTRSDVKGINDKLNGKKCYIFGAHIFAQILVEFGLNEDLVVSLLDNDPLKQEKRLYGTSLFVKNPNIIKNVKTPIVIVRAGTYSEEIKSQLREINKDVNFY